MVEAVWQLEADPAEYPAVSGLPAGADLAMLWQRIEKWVAVRWAPRTVTWHVAGPGTWYLPLGPVVEVVSTEAWKDGAWQPAELPENEPGALEVPEGHSRIVAVIGAGPVPASVAEAVRRMASFLAEPQAGVAGATTFSEMIDGNSVSFSRPGAWKARALHDSGAADLLRPYRRRAA